MKKMREWKSWRGLHRALRQRGYRGDFQRISMRSWRNSASPLVSMALPNSWFREIGLVDLTKYSVGIVSQFYERGPLIQQPPFFAVSHRRSAAAFMLAPFPMAFLPGKMLLE
jgi:hypothetical protein